MKKVLSVVLALTFIFSAVPLSCVADLVKDIDFGFLSLKASAASTNVSIEYIPEKEYTIFENTQGFWCENEENSFYYYYTPERCDGDILRITSGGVTKDYVHETCYDSMFEEGYFCEYCCSTGGSIDASLVEFYNYQYSSPWTVGGDNYITVMYQDYSTQVPVNIIENPIKSIEYIPNEPLVITENTSGYWCYLDNENEYFEYYVPYFSEGDVLVVEDKDGNTVEYIFDDDWKFVSNDGDVIEECELKCESNQPQEPWNVGSDNYFVLTYNGVSTQVPVTIEVNNVKSVEFIPVEPLSITENTCGEWIYSNDEKDFYYYNAPSLFNCGDILRIEEGNGNYVDYTYNEDWVFASADGAVIEQYEVYCESDQYNKHWSLGNKNYFCVVYLGVVSNDVPVTIIQNTVSSIDYIPAIKYSYVEFSKGYWSERYNSETEENEDCFFYYGPSRTEGDILRITDIYGKTTDYTYTWDEELCDNIYVSSNGDIIKYNQVDFYSNQWETPWNAGTNNYVTISYSGISTKIPVIITESRVIAISYVPAMDTKVALKDVVCYYEDDGAIFFNYVFDYRQIGSKLILTYKDGTEETFYTNGYDFISGNNYIEGGDVSFEWNEETQKCEVTYLNVKTSIQFEFDEEKAVKTIEYIPSGSLELIKDYDGYREDGVFRYSMRSNDGDMLKVTYQNGLIEILTYKETDFYDEDGEPVSVRFSCGTSDTWSLGNNTAYVYYGGVKREITVKLVENPFKSISYVPINQKKSYFNSSFLYSSVESRYNCDCFDAGDKIVAVDKTGRVYTYTYEIVDNYISGYPRFVCEQTGAKNLVSWSSYLSIAEQADLVGSYVMTIECFGCTTTCPVTVVKNSVVDFTFTPISSNAINLYRDAANSYSGSGGVDGFSWDCFYDTSFVKGDAITVKYSDNSTKKFTYNGELFVDSSGNVLTDNVTRHSSAHRNVSGKWTVLNEVNYAGKSQSLNIPYVDDVLKVEFVVETPIIIDEDDYVYAGSVYKDDETGKMIQKVYKEYPTPALLNYGYIKVTFTDNSYETYRKNADGVLVDSNGEKFTGFYFYLSYYDSQEGNNKSVYLYFMGQRVRVPVTIGEVCNHSYANTVVKPTCTESGYTVHVCSICKNSYVDSYVNSTGHNMVLKTAAVSATCTATGKTAVYACSNAGCTHTEGGVVIAAKGHNFSIGWTIDKAATCTTEGSKSHHCLNCTAKNDVTAIPKTEHTYENGVCTSCGDWQYKNTVLSLGKVTNQNGSVKLTWSAVTGADGYVVYRKAGSATKWTALKTVTGTSYTDKSVKTGTKYVYTVRATCNGVKGKYNSKGITTYYLAQPTVKAANQNGSVKVSWGKITGAKSYIVYRKAGSATKWTKVATVTTNTYTDKSVKSGTNYTYTVRAVNGTNNSAYNTKGVATKYLAQPTLGTPVSAKAGVTVKWGKVAGATGYIVYRKTGSGSFAKIATVKGNTKVSYLDKSAKKGTTYTYTVKAYYGSYYSAYNTKGVSIKDKY